MIRLLWNSRSSMMAQQEKLDCISNNIANVNTNGYKKVTVNFEDLVYDSLEREGYPVSQGKDGSTVLQNGTGIKTGEWTRDFNQGNLTETNLATDLAIDGMGFFEVIQPDGSKAYTRAGNFMVDATGTLVDQKGNRLSITDKQGNEINKVGGPYKFEKNNFHVESTGIVTIKSDNKDITIGKMRVVDAVGNNSMSSIGDNLFMAKPGATVLESKDYSIMQGYLEQSNVDIGTEMTDMIMTQRAFQLSSTTLKTADEMWQMANNLRGK